MAEQDLEQTIRDNATGPAKATGDTGSIEQHNPKDQIAVDRYLAAKAAAKKGLAGLKRTKAIPPGTV